MPGDRTMSLMHRDKPQKFASSEIGERILGQPLFSAEAVARRKRELIALLRAGLLAPEPRPIESYS